MAVKKIVFGPEIAPAAWGIGQSLLPQGFSIETLSLSPDQRIEQLESAEFYMGFRGGVMDRDYDHTTHHMICEHTLNLMKRDAILINCARGELVNKIKCLRCGSRIRPRAVGRRGD
jgi:hypothetical protein